MPAKIEVHAKFEGDSLVLTAEEVLSCRDETTKVFAHREVVTRSLPPSHWGILIAGASTAILGGGTAFYGQSLIDEGRSRSLGSPAQERRYDRGLVLVPVGLVVSTIGSLLLGSEAVDGFAVRDQIRALPDTTVVTTAEPKECGRRPAADIELTLGPIARVRTNGSGTASVAVFQPPLVDLPFQTPFLEVTCDRCRPEKVSLPPDIALRLVLPSAKSALEAGEHDRARAVLANCNQPECASLKAEIDRSQAAALLKEATLAMKSKDFAKVLRASKVCVGIPEAPPRCGELLRQAQEVTYLITVGPRTGALGASLGRFTALTRGPMNESTLLKIRNEAAFWQTAYEQWKNEPKAPEAMAEVDFRWGRTLGHLNTAAVGIIHGIDTMDGSQIEAATLSLSQATGELQLANKALKDVASTKKATKGAKSKK